MSSDLMEFLLIAFFFLVLLGCGFFAGSWAESRHYRSIRQREEELRGIMVFAIRTPPEGFLPCRTQFVSGSAVIGMDYFKTFVAMLRNLTGGRVTTYESLVDRARREAVLRMKAEARELDARAVINVKFSTANIMSGDKDNKGSGCVEVVAYGTAMIPER